MRKTNLWPAVKKGIVFVGLVLVTLGFIFVPAQALDHISKSSRGLTGILAASGVVERSTRQIAVLFADNFERADGSSVGNGWVEIEALGGNVGISNGRSCFLDTSDLINLPLVRHSFQKAGSGVLHWLFDFDWQLVSADRNYQLFMQLGDSTLMDDGAQDSGVGVNLVWTQIGGLNESLGWRDNGVNTALTPLSGAHSVSVEADLEAKKYQVSVDGAVVASGLPFEQPVNVDTVRIFTSALDETNFAGRCFDNLRLKLIDSVPTATPTTLPPTNTPTATPTEPLRTNTPTTDPTAIDTPQLPPTSTLTPSPTTDPRLPRNTPTPTETQTGTEAPPSSGNLLTNPGFAAEDGECFGVHTTEQITGWTHEYFGFGGTQENFPINQEWPVCSARTKGELHEVQDSGSGSIPEGETGRLWQVVAAPSYSAIIFKDARMEHEDGLVIHRLYGCKDSIGDACRLIAETRATVPQVTTKSICDAYIQVIGVDAAGGTSSVEYADPTAGCPQENLPEPVSFSANFAIWPYLKVEVEIDPLPDGEGRSGYKAGWWGLEVLN
ncbi:MAG TPA: hypothetical protein VFZ76_01310 [Anaerolineales bacterium]